MTLPALKPSDCWLTPPGIIEALGPFDLDPCASIDQPWATARHHCTILDNGLARVWTGRVWLNMPFSDVSPWLARLAEHGIGTALVFSKTECRWFFEHVWRAASAVLFIEGRLRFHLPDGRQARKDARNPCALVAYGLQDADRLADSGIAGAFVPLACTGQIVAVLRPANDGAAITWLELIETVARRQGGQITVSVACVLIRNHPKAAGNRHLDAKVRQVCQGPQFERVARGQFRLKGVA